MMGTLIQALSIELDLCSQPLPTAQLEYSRMFPDFKERVLNVGWQSQTVDCSLPANNHKALHSQKFYWSVYLWAFFFVFFFVFCLLAYYVSDSV